jgi:Uma2 family endonuclease
MIVATAHPTEWTVDELYALPEDGMRHELLDGTLLVSPPPSVRHQLAAQRLVLAIASAAPADIEILQAVGVVVPAGLLVPDVVVAEAAAVHGGRQARALAAEQVLAVAEIVSPSSRTTDRRWKPEAYAEAGIPIFVRLELDSPDGPVVHAFTLVDGTYVAAATLTGPHPQQAALPFAVDLTPATLVGPPSLELCISGLRGSHLRTPPPACRRRVRGGGPCCRQCLGRKSPAEDFIHRS